MPLCRLWLKIKPLETISNHRKYNFPAMLVAQVIFIIEKLK